MPCSLAVAPFSLSATVVPQGFVQLSSSCSLIHVEQDVDFNVSKMSKTMRKNIEKNNMRIIIVPHRDRKDRFAATLLESAPGMLDATKIDIAVNTNLSKLLPFTVEIDGVTVVGPHLLLVNKIRCAAERKGNVDVRVHNDLSDIMFLLNHIMDNNLGDVPLELVHILDADIWERFWSRVDDYAREDRILYETLMIELGLPCL